MSYSNWRPLGYTITTGAIANVVTPRFDAANFLRIYIRCPGTVAASAIILRFNSDANAVNYSYAFSKNFAAPTTAVAGSATGVFLSPTATAASGMWVVDVINFDGRPHGVTWRGAVDSEAAAVAPTISIGSGMWASTSQIFWCEIACVATSFNAGSDIAVFGHD